NRESIHRAKRTLLLSPHTARLPVGPHRAPPWLDLRDGPRVAVTCGHHVELARAGAIGAEEKLAAIRRGRRMIVERAGRAVAQPLGLALHVRSHQLDALPELCRVVDSIPVARPDRHIAAAAVKS